MEKTKKNFHSFSATLSMAKKCWKYYFYMKILWYEILLCWKLKNNTKKNDERKSFEQTLHSVKIKPRLFTYNFAFYVLNFYFFIFSYSAATDFLAFHWKKVIQKEENETTESLPFSQILIQMRVHTLLQSDEEGKLAWELFLSSILLRCFTSFFRGF